jgi:uncharacterized membrane protein/protein-disulfide isomerase
MSDSAVPAADSISTSAALRWTLRGLALGGAGVSGYLFALGWLERSLPAGCGAGSDCAEVLTSRWAAVLGVPVSGPAMLVHLGVLAGSLLIGPRQPPGRRAAGWHWLLVCAALLAGGAAWFIALQAVVLGAFCPWCMGDHALGLVAAGLIFWSAPAGGGEGGLSWRSYCGSVGLGVAATAALAVAQWAVPYRAPAALRLPAGRDADTGPGPDRAIQVLDGQLLLEPHREPTLGSPDAPRLVVMLYDYCCPHCRQTHGELVAALAEQPDRIALVLLPMPRDADCNPHFQETEPRFEHACELARLALAVHRVDPARFAEFDRWLYEPELPRDPHEARRQAESLVPAAALDTALADPALEQDIRRNCDAHHQACQQAQIELIPVLLSPGLAPYVGKPNADQLQSLLDDAPPVPTRE